MHVMVQTNLVNIAVGGKTKKQKQNKLVFELKTAHLYVYPEGLAIVYFKRGFLHFLLHVERLLTGIQSERLSALHNLKGFPITTTYCVIMCECKQHVSLVCQIYDLSSNAAFHIAKELLVWKNRQICSHPIVQLFSKHFCDNLVL